MKLKEAQSINPNAILVNSGVLFDVFDPKPELITIEDIGHALSHLCRYGGHTPKFYSVAQHAVFCSYYPGTLTEQIEYLLHDSSEAYMVDLPRPIKRNLPQYTTIEDNLLKIILEHFKVDFPLSEQAHLVDNLILSFEYYNFFEIKNKKFNYWSPSFAKKMFISRYYELVNGIKNGMENDPRQHDVVQVKFLEEFGEWQKIKNLAGVV